MNRRELSIALLQKINGTFGNLLADIRSEEDACIFVFTRLIRVPQICVKPDKTFSYYLDQHIMVVLYMTDELCSIWKSTHLNDTFTPVYYDMIEQTSADILYEELRKAIGYNY